MKSAGFYEKILVGTVHRHLKQGDNVRFFSRGHSCTRVPVNIEPITFRRYGDLRNPVGHDVMIAATYTSYRYPNDSDAPLHSSNTIVVGVFMAETRHSPFLLYVLTMAMRPCRVNYYRFEQNLQGQNACFTIEPPRVL